MDAASIELDGFEPEPVDVDPVDVERFTRISLDDNEDDVFGPTVVDVVIVVVVDDGLSNTVFARVFDGFDEDGTRNILLDIKYLKNQLNKLEIIGFDYLPSWV